MDWGCKRLLHVDVVTLSVRNESSEIGFHHQAVANKGGVTELVRKKSPPLMIEFFHLAEMRKTYRTYVQDIIQNDLVHYVEIAYEKQTSKLPERLLSAVSQWYQGGDESNDKVLTRPFKELDLCAC
jgi:hypothetical protein